MEVGGWEPPERVGMRRDYGSPFESRRDMSKHNNVNPDQYKLAGRERPGDGILHEQNKERASVQEHELREEAKQGKRKQRNGRRSS